MAQRGTVLVLGGSSGIGEATVRRLAADGVPVLSTHRTGADRAARICAELGEGVRTVPCDVRDPGSLADAFAAAGEGLAGVVHCAGSVLPTTWPA